MTASPRQVLPLSVVAKPTGSACNLDCEYCFFLSKEVLYDVPRQEMSDATLESYVDRYLAVSPDGPVVTLWQGGEPTLRGIDFFRRVVELCARMRRPGQDVHHAIQTNATLIDDDWAAFLAQEQFLVGVSFDGPARLHDRYRLNRGGRGTYDLVRRGWDALQRHEVDTNVLCTVNRCNEEHGLEVYRHFRDELGARYMQFIPIVERVTETSAPFAESGWRNAEGGRVLYVQDGERTTSRSVTPGGFGRFMCEVFGEWVNRDVGSVFVQDVDGALAAEFSRGTTCVHSPSCGNNVAMEFNGDVYVCDHWVEPDWRLGSVLDSDFSALVSTPTMAAFSEKKNQELTDECRACPFLRYCWGGCPKDRFVVSSSGQAGHNYLCSSYRAFYGCIQPAVKGMADLIRHGVEPAAIMDPDVRKGLELALVERPRRVR